EAKSGRENCLHMEFRIRGVKALQRIGVNSVKDLIAFDHGAFWEARLKFCTIDTRILGRICDGKAERRDQWIKQFGGIRYDVYQAKGNLLIRTWGMQKIVNIFGAKLKRYLIEIEISHWTPSGHGKCRVFNRVTELQGRSATLS